MREFKIVIKEDPRTKKNHQEIYKIKGKHFVVPSKQYKYYAQIAFIFLDEFRRKNKIQDPIDYPVNIKATYYMKTRRKVDIANLHNALHDLLVDARILADDDCKIIVSTDGSRVRYGKEKLRTEIVITEITDEEDLKEVDRMTVKK